MINNIVETLEARFGRTADIVGYPSHCMRRGEFLAWLEEEGEPNIIPNEFTDEARDCNLNCLTCASVPPSILPKVD